MSEDMPSLPTIIVIALLCSILPPLLAVLSWMIWPLEVVQ